MQKPRYFRCLEGKRMASGHTGNVVPGNRLRVRLPCPPFLQVHQARDLNVILAGPAFDAV